MSLESIFLTDFKTSMGNYNYLILSTYLSRNEIINLVSFKVTHAIFASTLVIIVTLVRKLQTQKTLVVLDLNFIDLSFVNKLTEGLQRKQVKL